MTAVRATAIRCDGCGEERSDYCTAAELRRYLRRPSAGGWVTGLPGGRDLCEPCRANTGYAGDER